MNQSIEDKIKEFIKAQGYTVNTSTMQVIKHDPEVKTLNYTIVKIKETP